jgi:hypothetical protein
VVQLVVREHLAQDDTGVSEVYVDGQRVAAATGRNMARSPIDRLRVGIVAITAGQQNEPLTVYFDLCGDAEGVTFCPPFPIARVLEGTAHAIGGSRSAGLSRHRSSDPGYFAKELREAA